MSRRVVVLAAVTAAVVAGTSSAATQDIVAGSKLGPVRVGMSLRDVNAALGSRGFRFATEARAFGRTWTEYAWGMGEWRVALLRAGSRTRVVRAGTSRATIGRTRDGIGIGSSRKLIEQVYGTRCYFATFKNSGSRDFPTPAGAWCVPGGGIAFRVEARCGRVAPGGRCAEGALEWRVSEVWIYARGEPAHVDLDRRRPVE